MIYLAGEAFHNGGRRLHGALFLNHASAEGDTSLITHGHLVGCVEGGDWWKGPAVEAEG